MRVSRPVLPPTWSEMVNLIAVTTVLRMRADSDERYFLSLGSSSSALTRVSLPRHSATTFLVPSSWHSQWFSSTDLGDTGWSDRVTQAGQTG